MELVYGEFSKIATESFQIFATSQKDRLICKNMSQKAQQNKLKQLNLNVLSNYSDMYHKLTKQKYSSNFLDFHIFTTLTPNKRTYQQQITRKHRASNKDPLEEWKQTGWRTRFK